MAAALSASNPLCKSLSKYLDSEAARYGPELMGLRYSRAVAMLREGLAKAADELEALLLCTCTEVPPGASRSDPLPLPAQMLTHFLEEVVPEVPSESTAARLSVLKEVFQKQAYFRPALVNDFSALLFPWFIYQWTRGKAAPIPGYSNHMAVDDALSRVSELGTVGAMKWLAQRLRPEG